MGSLSRNVVMALLAGAAALGLLSCTGTDTGTEDPPKQAFEVGYCGEPDHGIGNLPAKKEILVYFTATKLAPYVGGEIRSIAVAYSAFSGNPDTREFEIELYGKGTASAPGTKLFDKTVTLKKGWNEISLDTPIAVHGDTELWAGYVVDMTDCWPATIDNEAGVPYTSFMWNESAKEYYRLMGNNYCVRLIAWK